VEGKFVDFNKNGQIGHGGNFDADRVCKTKTIKHMPHKQCCGKYPKRKLFRTDMVEGGYRQCCSFDQNSDENEDENENNFVNDGQSEGKIFFPDRQVCCGKFGVQDGGECKFYE